MVDLVDCAFRDGSYPCGYKDGGKLPDCDLCHKIRKASIREVVERYKRDNPSVYAKYQAYWRHLEQEWGL